MTEITQPPARDYKLAAVIPWLTRAEPLTAIKTDALASVYEVATTNMQTADAILTSVASGFLAAAQLQNALPANATIPDALRIAFSAWQAITHAEQPTHAVKSIVMPHL